MITIITALWAFLKAIPEFMALMKPLTDAYKDHEKEAVRAELDSAFDRLKKAKDELQKQKALDDLSREYGSK